MTPLIGVQSLNRCTESISLACSETVLIALRILPGMSNYCGDLPPGESASRVCKFPAIRKMVILSLLRSIPFDSMRHLRLKVWGFATEQFRTIGLVTATGVVTHLSSCRQYLQPTGD